jgi:hypothetical protein
MGSDTKQVSGVSAYFSDTEVTLRPQVHLHSAYKAADPDENPSEEQDQPSFDQPGAMPHEMAPILHPYVLLNFLPLSEASEKRVPVAVVFHQNTVPIIMIRHNWQERFDAEDCEYFGELMDDWMKTPPERVLALFRQLECLSAGPIRATVSGIATAEGLENLMYAVLTHSGGPGQLPM